MPNPINDPTAPLPIAYWMNGLGEEMSSRVHAYFKHGETEFVVVHDWREGTLGHGFIILETGKLDSLRLESPR